MSDDHPSILIVEDQPQVLEMYVIALRDQSEVHTATRGREALDVVDQSIDVVLLDRHMPGLSGDEVLVEMREADLDTPVAMATAVDPDFEIIDIPLDAYLTKPVSIEELRSIVSELQDLQRYEKRAREFIRLAEKKFTLQRVKSCVELEANETYQRLQERQGELADELAPSSDGTLDVFMQDAISPLRAGNTLVLDGDRRSGR